MNEKNSNYIKLISYYKSSETAQKVVSWAYTLNKDESETSIEAIEAGTGIQRGHLTEFARKIDDLGFGRYIMGRKGAKSRIEWHYGLKAFIENVSSDIANNSDKIVNVSIPNNDLKSIQNLTIADAKRQLSASLGVPENAIEITVRA